VNQVGIPCLFKYFTHISKLSKGFAFYSTTESGRAFISFTENVSDVEFYCYSAEENNHSCFWIPFSPVLKELYEIEGLL
jgi:hypothetical protein